MKTIDPKYLAIYLPYDLQFSLSNVKYRFSCVGISLHQDGVFAHDEQEGTYNVSLEKYYKPILRNAHGFMTAKLFYDNGNWITAIEAFPVYSSVLTSAALGDLNIDSGLADLPYSVVDQLAEKHFDIFGLVESGLAFDMDKL